MRLDNMFRLISLILLLSLSMAGCSGQLVPRAPTPPTIEHDRFIIATAVPGDTLAAMAHTYLGDTDKAWQIAAYNDIDTVSAGQRVVIPRVPLSPGGIGPKGYQTVPVLLYTGIANGPSKSKAVGAAVFDRQLQYLESNGYTTISLDQLGTFLNLQDQLPQKAVVISFDTTHRQVYEIAFPLLKKRQMKAALFIRHHEIGTKGMLTWTQIVEMAKNGFQIGIRGSQRKPTEKENPKHFLESFEKTFTAHQKDFRVHLKNSCRYFAHPRGETNDLAIAMLKKHGYQLAFTRKRGSNPFFMNNYRIRRSLIHGRDDMAKFRKNLTTFKSAELK